MVKRLRLGALTIACGLLLTTLFALPSVAFAEGNIEGDNDVYLTKVISVKAGIKVVDDLNDKKDTYTFHFAGAGLVEEVSGKLVSGATNEKVEQDNSMNEGWTVPVLGDENGNVTIEAVDIPNTSAYETSTNSGTYVGAVHTSLKTIVNNATFAQPGIYTYRVTETATNKGASGSNVAITPSQASYLMKVKVLNNDTSLTPTDIVVLKEKDDEGDPNGSVYINQSRKVDPTYPKLVSDTAQIDTTVNAPSGVALGSDDRGRDVYGFTFTNEYVTGMAFSIKKEVSGQMASKTQTFPITIKFTDQSAPPGCRYVYAIYEGTSEVAGTLNAAEFGTDKKATLEAQIKHGQYIKVIGLQGSLYNGMTDPTDSTNYTPSNTSRAWFNDGLVPSTTYQVIEDASKNYQGSIFTFNSDKPDEITSTSTDVKTTVAVGIASKEVGTEALTTDGAAKTVLILNTYDESNTSFTGIFINNLPYILMVAVPLGIFAIMFVSRRRANGRAA